MAVCSKTVTGDISMEFSREEGESCSSLAGRVWVPVLFTSYRRPFPQIAFPAGLREKQRF
jgi:hypothetical protein